MGLNRTLLGCLDSALSAVAIGICHPVLSDQWSLVSAGRQLPLTQPGVRP